MAKLRNTLSGTTGELKVAGELSRAGLRVAEPYWNDDEVDLLIFCRVAGRDVSVPVQVKSLQFSGTHGTKSARRFVEGLKKKYIERSPGLCLALYCPDTDRLWFVPGSNAICDVYDLQASWNSKHRRYKDLPSSDDVRIALGEGTAEIDSKWLVTTERLQAVADRVMEVAESLLKDREPLGEPVPTRVALTTKTRLRLEIQESDGTQALSHTIEGSIDRLIPTAYSAVVAVAEKVFGTFSVPLADCLLILRELLVNAVAHRAYDEPGDVVCTLSPSCIHVSSPGRLPPPVTVNLGQEPTTCLAARSPGRHGTQGVWPVQSLSGDAGARPARCRVRAERPEVLCHSTNPERHWRIRQRSSWKASNQPMQATRYPRA